MLIWFSHVNLLSEYQLPIFATFKRKEGCVSFKRKQNGLSLIPDGPLTGIIKIIIKDFMVCKYSSVIEDLSNMCEAIGSTPSGGRK